MLAFTQGYLLGRLRYPCLTLFRLFFSCSHPFLWSESERVRYILSVMQYCKSQLREPQLEQASVKPEQLQYIYKYLSTSRIKLYESVPSYYLDGNLPEGGVKDIATLLSCITP